MKLIQWRIFFIVLLAFNLSSCGPRATIHTLHKGDPLDISEVAFVTTTWGASICSVNGEIFPTKVLDFRFCYRDIELAAPKTYKITAWNGTPPQTSDNTTLIEFNAEPGKLYLIYNDHRKYLQKWNANLIEVTDPKEIKKYHDKITSGELKRELPQPVTGKQDNN